MVNKNNFIIFTIGTIHCSNTGCNCSTVGSNNPQECAQNGGQCSCKPNVIGRTCSACRPDHFNFTSGQGCTGETKASELMCIGFVKEEKYRICMEQKKEKV